MPEIEGKSGNLDQGSIFKGFFVGCGANLAMILVLCLMLFIDSAVMPFIFAIGVVQFAWIFPMYRHWSITLGQTETGKGILLSAAITFLLFATCAGIMWQR